MNEVIYLFEMSLLEKGCRSYKYVKNRVFETQVV